MRYCFSTALDCMRRDSLMLMRRTGDVPRIGDMVKSCDGDIELEVIQRHFAYSRDPAEDECMIELHIPRGLGLTIPQFEQMVQRSRHRV